ncbi:MAG: Hsp20/alpha crystallin family protein [Dehalococcoidales bacterium]|nr:Hsp20/alpha crystallin family protein [Dehalococcoidales bacterium]
MMIQFRHEWIDDVNVMRQEMGRLLDHLAAAKPPMVRFSPTFWEPAIDVYETDDDFVITVELAGVREHDIQITVDRNTFTIRGERNKDIKGGKTAVYHQMEIASGRFERSIVLPQTVDAENARAAYENGLLEIILPKMRKERTVRVGIKVMK